LEAATPKKARVFTHEDFTLISHMRNYTFNKGFEADYGVWEEGPEEHSSSFGAVLGGLMMWFDQAFYDYKCKNKIEISRYVPVSERMIADGFGALSRVLPRESGTRPYDLSQLSLIWPYNIIDFDTKKQLLHNIETHPVGPRGVRRYPGDVYHEPYTPGFTGSVSEPGLLNSTWPRHTTPLENFSDPETFKESQSTNEGAPSGKPSSKSASIL
jgi:hypothetical protein